MTNLKIYIDFLFYLRGFLAFILVPIIFLFDIFPFSNILLYSNVYLNNYRFPNLNEPIYYCSLYFLFIISFLIFIDLVLKKYNLENNIKIFSKIKNTNIFFIFIFFIIIFLKLRILFNLDYLNNVNYLGDLLINNFYTNFLIHFFLPNELVFLLISIYYEKLIKNKLVNSLFVIYIFLTLISTVIFGSRYLFIISIIMLVFLVFKFVKTFNFKHWMIFAVLIITSLFFTFVPYEFLYKHSILYNTDLLQSLKITFEHLIWRLDIFHIVDLGYSSGEIIVNNTNLYGRNVGLITLQDLNTGIEFPFFYDYIKIENSILINTVIIILCSFVFSIFYTVLKLISISFGTFFYVAFLFRICTTWPEISIDQINIILFKLLVVVSLVVFYLFFERKTLKI